MFKIVLTAMDANVGTEPYLEDIGSLFENRDRAEIYMLHTMNEELSELNQPDAYNTPHTRVFIADLNGEHDAIIRLWDGDDYWDVSYYDIVEVEADTDENDELAKYNAMLRKTHGKNITVEIKSYIEDDDSVRYYYTTARYGDSDDTWDTAEGAYKEANSYLHGVGELW